MITKKITYTDYNGNKRTEEFCFHLNKAELMKLELGVKGGLTEMMQRIISAQDSPEMIKVFEELVLKSYGVKSLDGRNFKKNKEVTEDFMQTEAYAELFMELTTDPKKAAEFFNGVIPAEMAKDLPTDYMDQIPEEYREQLKGLQ